MEKQSKNTIIGTSVGVIAGAIAGILLVTKSGKETRDDIASHIQEIKDKIANELTEAGNMTKESYSGIVEKVVKVYELGKKITAEDAQDIKKKLDDHYDEVEKTIKAKRVIEIKKTAQK